MKQYRRPEGRMQVRGPAVHFGKVFCLGAPRIGIVGWWNDDLAENKKEKRNDLKV